MQAILFVIVGLFLFADDASQQSTDEKPAPEKHATKKTDDSKQTSTTLNEQSKQNVKEPVLRKELLERAKRDQEWRVKADLLSKKTGAHSKDNIEKLSLEDRLEFIKFAWQGTNVDQENTKWLKQVIKMHGWPTFTLVGKDGAGAAWLLVQHADLDPKFQRECLDLIAKLPMSEVSKSNFAYLTDRVLLAEKKKQIYGTQVTETSEGKLIPLPIEDEKNVDILRKEVGLPTMVEYLASIEETRAGVKKSSDKK